LLHEVIDCFRCGGVVMVAHRGEDDSTQRARATAAAKGVGRAEGSVGNGLSVTVERTSAKQAHDHAVAPAVRGGVEHVTAHALQHGPHLWTQGVGFADRAFDREVRGCDNDHVERHWGPDEAELVLQARAEELDSLHVGKNWLFMGSSRGYWAVRQRWDLEQGSANLVLSVAWNYQARVSQAEGILQLMQCVKERALPADGFFLGTCPFPNAPPRGEVVGKVLKRPSLFSRILTLQADC
jgi:hypothetical protein